MAQKRPFFGLKCRTRAARIDSTAVAHGVAHGRAKYIALRMPAKRSALRRLALAQLANKNNLLKYQRRQREAKRERNRLQRLTTVA